MVCLEWWCLNDDELNVLLNKKKDQGVKLLKVHGYKLETLTFTPQLTLFSQFNLLVHLDLSWNRIDELILEHVPETVEILNLAYNQLQMLPSLVKFRHLKELYVNNNQIQAVHPDLPLSPTVIDMSFNRIEVMPPLGKLVQLRDVNLSNNRIQDLLREPFPLGLESLDLSYNCIQVPLVLGKMSRLHDLDLSYNQFKVINPVIPTSLETVNLSGNGFKALPSLLDTKVKSLYLLDLPELTSLSGLPVSLRSLELGDNTSPRSLTADCFPSKSVYHLVHKALGDRVQLLEQPVPQVFKQGHGMLLRYFKEDLCRCSYNHLTLVGASESGKTSLLRSLIKSRSSLAKNIDRTAFVKVKTWRIDEKTLYQVYDHSGAENSMDSIVNHLLKRDQGTSLIVHSLNHSSKHQIDRTLRLFKQIVQTSQSSKVHFVLTHSDKYSQSNANNFVDRFRKSVESAIAEQPANQNGKDKNTTDDNTSSVSNKLDHVKYFLVSCKTYSGVEDVRNHLIKAASCNKVCIPGYWNQVLTACKETGNNYAKLSQIEAILKECHGSSKSNLNTRAVSVKTQDCLQFLNDTGLVIWVRQNFNLRKFVFHNVGFIASVFKVLFQHDVKETLDYERNKLLQQAFTEKQYNNALSQCTHNGLMHERFLVSLWTKVNSKVDDNEAFLELLKHFQICYQISNNVKADNYMYIPWFVSNDLVPDSLMLSNPLIIDSHFMSLAFRCVVKPNIPPDFLERICVYLQCYATDHHGYKGQRSAWTAGLMVKVGQVEHWLYRDDEDHIWACVRGLINDLDVLWERLAQMFSLVQTVAMEYFKCDLLEFLEPESDDSEIHRGNSKFTKSKTFIIDAILQGKNVMYRKLKLEYLQQKDQLQAVQTGLDPRKIPGYKGQDPSQRNHLPGHQPRSEVQKSSSDNTNDQKTIASSDSQKLINSGDVNSDVRNTGDASGKGPGMRFEFPCPHCVLFDVLDPHYWSLDRVWTAPPPKKPVCCPVDEEREIPVGMIYRVNKGESKKIQKVTDYIRENWSAVPQDAQLAMETKSYLRSKLKVFQSIMLTSPVIEDLGQRTLISDKTRQTLRDMDSSQQVLKIFNKVILRGSEGYLAEFREILQNTGYHANITLSKMLPDIHDQNYKVESPTELLTKGELEFLEGSFFQTFVSQVDPDELIPSLCSNGMLHPCQQDELQCISSSHGRVLYLMDQVLLRGTYHTLMGFRASLGQCQYTQLLDQLPARTGNNEAENSSSEIGMNLNFTHWDQRKSDRSENKKSQLCVIL